VEETNESLPPTSVDPEFIVRADAVPPAANRQHITSNPKIERLITDPLFSITLKMFLSSPLIKFATLIPRFFI
jgi:hypothetical protein